MSQIILNNGSAPATPAAGKVAVYSKTDKKLYAKDDAGVETELGGGAGAVDSVNGYTGVIVLNPDDLDDSATTNKFVDASDLTKLGYITITQAVDLDTVESDLSSHIANTANPHSVTQTQVGLGNVDNTSDANKPVSTAQGAADTAVQSFSIQRANHTGTQDLSTLAQSSATTGQVPSWNGTSWVPNTPTVPTWGSIVGTLPDQEDLRLQSKDLMDGDGSYYLHSSASDLGGGRYEMIRAVPSGGGFGITNTAVYDTQVLATWATLTGVPDITTLPSGPFGFIVKARQVAGTKVSKLYAEFNVRSILGFSTTIATSNLSQVLTGTNQDIRAFATAFAVENLLTTDHLELVIKANVSGAGTDPDIIIDVQGTTGSKCKFPYDPVFSVNGRFGDVVLDKTDVGLDNVDNTTDLNKPISTDTQAALDLKLDAVAGSNDRLVWKNDSGIVESNEGYVVNTYNGLDRSNNILQNNEGNYKTLNQNYLSVNAAQDSDNDAAVLNNCFIEVDTDLSGFNIGTNQGSAIQATSTFIKHVGTSDVGGLNAFQTSFEIGNGTDPIDVRGFSYHYGFGQVRSGVTLSGGMQGYGFQPNVEAGVDIQNYSQAFYDNTQIASAVNGYSSFISGPTIAEVKNNSWVSAFSSSPNMPLFTGNAGYTGLGLYGTFGTFDTGGYTGVQVNPTISSVKYAVGLDVSMDNVTVTSGTTASVVIQDITITTVDNTENYNGSTFELVDDVTAGSENVTGSNPTFQIHIESGVSTATQVKTALDAFGGLSGQVTTTISGVASNPQIAQVATAMSGGAYPGNKKAARLDGDVEITGSLSFGGVLSVGQLSAFASQPLFDGGGNPASIHTLITQPTVGDNTTVNNADLLGVNTACLLSIGHDSVVTTAFLGIAAMGLPAIVQMGNNSTVDRIAGGVFAISLSGGGTGAVIDAVDLCKTLAQPDGVTTVNKLVGYKMELPFGDPGTTTWGVYITPAVHNYFAGSVKVGTGADVATSGFAFDVVGGFRTESSLGEMLRANDSGLSFFGNTEALQQASSGPQTAGALYTSTEQTMIQEMYDALRTYGLLT